MGATVLAMLAMLYLGIKWSPCKVLYYMPDMKLSTELSSTRFLPIVRSLPDVHYLLTGGGPSEGNVLTRTMQSIGSLYRFLWTSSKAGGVTESFPGDLLFMDEVQGMTLEQIDRVYERLSASRMRYRFLLSTALFPDLDINAFYLMGDQRTYHSDCSCANGCVVSDYFFDAFLNNREDEYPVTLFHDDWHYMCPVCGDLIADPQDGSWMAMNPTAEFRSYHLPQTLSPTIRPAELLRAARMADTSLRRQNFSCRKLGRPFVDAGNLLATLETLRRCSDEGRRVGVQWKESANGTCMGIDQMGGFSVVTIAERMPDGRMAIIHVELIQQLNPWERLDVLIKKYGVVVCVVEQLPDIDSARMFAHRHRGKVWLVTSYQDREDFVGWGDVAVSASDRKTKSEFFDPWTLQADRYRVLDWAAARLREQFILFPDPARLQASYRDERGDMRRGPVLQEVFWKHYTKTGLLLQSDEDSVRVATAKRMIIKMGLDPHASFSLMMLCLAWFRAYGTTHFILPGGNDMSLRDDMREDTGGGIPGLPSSVAAMMESKVSGQCGKCLAFAKGFCTELQMQVGAADPGCSSYVDDEGEEV